MAGSLRETPEKKDRPQSHCCVPSGKSRRPVQRIFINQRGKYTYPAEPGRYTSVLWDLTNRRKDGWAIDFEADNCSYWLKKQQNMERTGFLQLAFPADFPQSDRLPGQLFYPPLFTA